MLGGRWEGLPFFANQVEQVRKARRISSSMIWVPRGSAVCTIQRARNCDASFALEPRTLKGTSFTGDEFIGVTKDAFQRRRGNGVAEEDIKKHFRGRSCRPGAFVIKEMPFKRGGDTYYQGHLS